MPDLNDLLGEEPEVWNGDEQKRGAPKIDAADLMGLLGD